MKKKNYCWVNYVPLTGAEALRLYRKGVDIFVLKPGKATVRVETKGELYKYARKCCLFAAKRDSFEKAETIFAVDYYVILPGTGGEAALIHPEKSPHFHGEYADRICVFEDCKKNLTALVRRYGLPDGTYWAEFVCDKIFLGEKQPFDYDEGEIVVKNGSVEKVPCGFAMPF